MSDPTAETFKVPDRVLEVLRRHFGMPERGYHEVMPRGEEKRFEFRGTVVGFLTYRSDAWHVIVLPEEFTKSDVDLSVVMFQANQELALRR